MIYVFGDFELDTQRYELRQASVLCALDPQRFNVLLYLVHQRDRVVSKDELLEQLWPHQSVSESTLTQRLRTVRQALGDSGRAQHTIKTTHGRGYRFIAAVEERSHEEETALPSDNGIRACPSCQRVNARDSRFCSACGTLLGLACLACAWENAPESQFCNACGESLETITPVSTSTRQTIQDTRRVEDLAQEKITMPFFRRFALLRETLFSL